jgi:hypothetical protein
MEAAFMATGMVRVNASLLLNIIVCISFLLLGIGLFRLAKWAWFVMLLGGFITAIDGGYVAWESMPQLYGQFYFIWKDLVTRAIICLMIVVYLLDGHVRRSFFTSEFKGESQRT